MQELNKIASEGGYDFSKKLEYGESRLLDPLFWQALGKACGWEEEKDGAGESFEDGKWHSTRTLNSWFDNALRFHEIILNEGMDKGIEYLKSIVVK